MEQYTLLLRKFKTMKNPICEETLPLMYPTDIETKNLYSWYVGNCVVNTFLTITAIILNSVTIHAVRKTSSLSKPLKTLLLSLAVSDLGVGLVMEPLYIALLVNWVQGNNSTGATCTAFLLISYLFSVASFLGVMALSVDRFLAIYLHLRYQELVTHKRVLAVVMAIWVFSSSLSLFGWRGTRSVAFVFWAFIVVFCISLSAVLYCKIYLVIRRHRNQMQALQVQQVAQNDEMTNFARLRNSALGTFYVYLIFLLCYLPQSCTLFAVPISGISTGVKVSSICSGTLVFLNSSWNPVVYCWKMINIRHAIMDIMRNFLPCHN